MSTSEESPPPTADPQVCGRLVAWSAAVLAGQVDVGAAAEAIGHGTDGQVAVGWSDWASPDDRLAIIPEVGVALAEHDFDDVFGRLLAADVSDVALVLPVAGDPLGLTGGGAFARAAVEAEGGVILRTARATIGLIPATDLRGSSYRGTRWRVYVEPVDGDGFAEGALPALDSVDPLRVLEQADRELSRALRDATVELDALDLAHWRPEVAAGRKEAEAALRAGGQRMPPGWPAPARALAERALMLWQIVKVARADTGAASAAGVDARGRALNELSHAVRHAAMVAYNVPVATLPIGRPQAREHDLAQQPPA